MSSINSPLTITYSAAQELLWNGWAPSYFERGETAVISAEITNTAGATDPDAIIIYIIDPTGIIQVNGATMTKDATGEYHYDYTLLGSVEFTCTFPIDWKELSGLGMWQARIKATKDSEITIRDGEFYVVKGVM